MSCHKFASNVCEKALVTAEPAMRQALVNEILAPRKDGIDVVVMMMKDQYGSESPLTVCLSDAFVDA